MKALILFCLVSPGQCYGNSCPPTAFSSAVFDVPTVRYATNPYSIVSVSRNRPAERSWLDAVMPDGSTRKVWGWRDGTDVCYFESEQPPKPVAISIPTPIPTVETPKKEAVPARPERPPTGHFEPPPVVGSLPAFATNGVDTSQIGKKEDYQASHPEAYHFVEDVKDSAERVPDDRDKPKLTVIGSPDAVKSVMDDVKGTGPLSKLAAEFHVQKYAPNSPYVQGMGFAAGNPAIYVQVGSKVVHKQLDYSGGEDKLVEAIWKSGAVRKPDPNYKPDADPDLRKPLLVPVSEESACYLILVASVAGFAFVKLKGGKP